MPSKFRFSSRGGDRAAPLCTNVWDIEELNGGSRLIIAPESNHLQLLIELAELLPDPFGMLYVLLVSRCDHELGRYQSPYPCSLEEIKEFVKRFTEFLEHDGRHNLWITSLPEKTTLVCDNHGIIYAYGAIEEYEKVLLRRGLEKGKVVNMSVPHEHYYNPEYDESEKSILSYWEWRRFPLHPDEIK
jgi:hypothetical protein